METKIIIKALTCNEGYFAAINQRANDAGISLAQAWREIEDLRISIGLPQKYKSAGSFYTSRHVHHQSARPTNDLIRFNEI